MPSSPAESRDLAVAGSGAMFDRIASRYDLLNRLISLGIDQSWRRKTVAALAPAAGFTSQDEVLDLATGTADLALLIARTYPGVRVVGVDPSREMMAVGDQKIRAQGLAARIELQAGDAQALPFDNGRFAAVSMAFGIRNVPDRPRALREILRVTRSGGRIAILELSEPKGGLLSWGARFHMHTLVPWLGALLSGAREYRYLPRSIAAFPPAEEFAELFRSCGALNVRCVELTFGVCHLYLGEAP